MNIVLEEEVYSILSNLNGDKAPRPNGNSMAFWQVNWVLVKEEMLGLFRVFFF